MTRAPCSCDHLWFEPHREGCPRRNDHSAADSVKAALLRRHPPDRGEWVSWAEVFSIDVFAMRFWSGGVGMRRVAYEVKVSRADFLQELRKPEKRAYAKEVAHQFVFATPKGLVNPREIPADCGLVELLPNGRVVTKVKAPVREPRWFTEQEVASLLRRDMFRSNVGRLKVRLQTAELRAEELVVASQTQRAELERAYKALVAVRGSEVQPGTVWAGGWLREAWSWRPGPAKGDLVQVEVLEVRNGLTVVFRVAHEEERGYHDVCGLGEFLCGFTRHTA